ncbi:hypothetical protein SDC9_80175 [bioreactor metagenome]|uniref:Uncharacterized protein n=1 Tax=bioreactor metagenome TaxID=1076179 RepID=A0A644YZX5_9ZZZZ
MIHITRIDYLNIKGQLIYTKEIDIRHSRSGLDALMDHFMAVWNMNHHVACREVMCVYKDLSKKTQ